MVDLTDYPPIQIVDEEDEPIGGATLNDVHTKGLRFRGIRVLVENTDGKLLIQKRAHHVATLPHYWDFATAGYVDEGEGYDEAARRELKEELGLQDLPLQELKKYDLHEVTDNKRMNQFAMLFKVIVNPDIEVTANEEVADIQWLEPSQIIEKSRSGEMQVTPGLLMAIDEFYL